MARQDGFKARRNAKKGAALAGSAPQPLMIRYP